MNTNFTLFTPDFDKTHIAFEIFLYIGSHVNNAYKLKNAFYLKHVKCTRL